MRRSEGIVYAISSVIMGLPGDREALARNASPDTMHCSGVWWGTLPSSGGEVDRKARDAPSHLWR